MQQPAVKVCPPQFSRAVTNVQCFQNGPARSFLWEEHELSEWREPVRVSLTSTACWGTSCLTGSESLDFKSIECSRGLSERLGVLKQVYGDNLHQPTYFETAMALQCLTRCKSNRQVPCPKLPSALSKLTKDTVEALQIVRYRKGEQYSLVLKFDIMMGYKLK